jgi:hypothetical protein
MISPIEENDFTDFFPLQEVLINKKSAFKSAFYWLA